MPDYVIDTNVLLIASAWEPVSPFKDEDLPADEMATVYAWLRDFMADPQQVLVMDGAFRLFDEYEHKLTEQDFGLRVILAKLPTARLVEVAYDGDGIAVLPAGLTGSLHDSSDRKFAAAALAAGGATLVNASDTDWYDCTEALFGAGIPVKQLLDPWCRAKYREKTGCAP